MKIIQLLTLFVLLSLQVGATGYSHNMFVAHKKLQAGKERTSVCDQPAVKKTIPAKVQATISAVNKSGESLSQQISDQFSKAVTLNQRIVEQGPSSLFVPNHEEEEEVGSSLVSDLVNFVKGAVFAFIGSLAVR